MKNQFLALALAGLFATMLFEAAAAHDSQGSIFSATVGDKGRAAEVSTDELRSILNDGETLILDVRPVEEFRISHIPGAVNVAPKPGTPMSQYVSDIHEIDRIVRGDKSKRLVLYCNGPLCGKSSRLAEELLTAGYTNVRRYQLGIPVWRALGGVTAITADGAAYVLREDRTAVFVDARPHEAFRQGSLPRARHIPVGEVAEAKDDGRLPMTDHNTRIVVFGTVGAEARAAAAEITKNAFHNVAFVDGPFDALSLTVQR